MNIISPAFNDVGVTPERVVDVLLQALDLEQEWAVAEYDSHGNVLHVSHQDYGTGPVLRSLNSAQESERKLREQYGIRTEGRLGLVSRIFTRWIAA